MAPSNNPLGKIKYIKSEIILDRKDNTPITLFQPYNTVFNLFVSLEYPDKISPLTIANGFKDDD